MKANTTVRETRTVTTSVKLSTGGFVEIELNEGDKGYLKVHLGAQKDYGPSQAWRWIQHAPDRDTTKLLVELRDACDLLIENIKPQP